MSDVVQSNPKFLTFFDQIFETYGVQRSIAQFKGSLGPSIKGTVPVTGPNEKSVLERRAAKAMDIELAFY
jgi:hypothetical protein